MIFSVADHIKQIIAGTKTQTRRASGKYQVEKTYSVQPCRTCKGIIDGKIVITEKRVEYRNNPYQKISEHDAQAEGGYLPEEFEKLYNKINPRWTIRYAYTFRFIPLTLRAMYLWEPKK